jgi:hypothetical protein
MKMYIGNQPGEATAEILCRDTKYRVSLCMLGHCTWESNPKVFTEAASCGDSHYQGHVYLEVSAQKMRWLTQVLMELEQLSDDSNSQRTLKTQNYATHFSSTRRCATLRGAHLLKLGHQVHDGPRHPPTACEPTSVATAFGVAAVAVGTHFSSADGCVVGPFRQSYALW